MTGIKLDLSSNIDIYNFIERGLRGGISYFPKRFREPNNKYMKDYDFYIKGELSARMT